MNKEQLWNIVLIISIILIIHGITQSGSSDKKTAQAGQQEAIAGGGGLLAFAMKKQVLFTGAMLWVMIAAGGLFLAPTIFSSWRNLFSPAIVPGWVWIIGFAMLFIMMMNRK